MSIPVSGDEMAPHAFLAIPLAAVVSVVHALSFFMVSLSLSLSWFQDSLSPDCNLHIFGCGPLRLWCPTNTLPWIGCTDQSQSCLASVSCFLLLGRQRQDCCDYC